MKRQKGEITVFLSLTLVIMIAVLFSVIERARTNAIEFQTECVADMALQSALAEYNRELLEQYDLFFIETGYGTQQSGYILLEQHIQDYMQKNFSIDNVLFQQEIKDLLMLSTESVTVSEAVNAMDGEGEVLIWKAIEFMLDKYGLPDITKLEKDTKEVTQNGLLEDEMEKKRNQNEKAIDSIDTTVTDSEGKKKRIPVNNPADKINSKRKSSGILKLITGEKPISDVEIQKEEYLSERIYDSQGLSLPGESRITLAEDFIFQKYLMEKCGTYTIPKENSLLAYQIEYMLAGKSSDYENLKAVVNQLLMIRETSNFMYLMSDSGKQAEAEALALTLAAVILFPELKDLIKYSILIAWAYAESVNDLHILLEGGKVPIWKDSQSWKLSLKNAMALKLDSGNGGTGLSYTEYLHILLTAMEKEKRNLRFMDLIEMDIRKTKGNEHFRMDHCIHGFTAEILVVSGKGNSCLINRSAYYEK